MARRRMQHDVSAGPGHGRPRLELPRAVRPLGKAGRRGGQDVGASAHRCRQGGRRRFVPGMHAYRSRGGRRGGCSACHRRLGEPTFDRMQAGRYGVGANRRPAGKYPDINHHGKAGFIRSDALGRRLQWMDDAFPVHGLPCRVLPGTFQSAVQPDVYAADVYAQSATLSRTNHFNHPWRAGLPALRGARAAVASCFSGQAT